METGEVLKNLKMVRESLEGKSYEVGELHVRAMLDDVIPLVERLIKLEKNDSTRE